MRGRAKQDEITVTGILVASEWDTDGKTIGFIIADLHENTYRLVCDESDVRSLMDHLRETIIVSGLPMKVNGSPAIEVKLLYFVDDSMIG